MSPGQKKAFLGVIITICLLVAGTKIYRFYEAHRPPFNVGECFSVTDDKMGELKFQVTENDNAKAVTTAVATINNPFGLQGVKLQIPVRGSYQEIRESNPKKVDCQ